MRGPFDVGWRRVICVASGPSFTVEQAELVRAAQRSGAWRVIVANRKWEIFHDADAMFAADRPFWNRYHEEIANGFRGERWTGDIGAAQAFGLRYIEVARAKEGGGLSPDPTKLRHGGNSGHSAVALAYAKGAEVIVLVGFDMQYTHGRAHDHADHTGHLCNPSPPALARWAERFEPTARDLAAAGVRVINCSRETALTCFPRADLAATLAEAETMPPPGLTSIIIPAFNHARFLPDAIDSALAQSAPVEVIVVDDGSEDDTAEVLAMYGERIRAIAIRHAGPGAARNAGLEIATGEFVMFLDADDVIESTKVELQRAHMDEAVGFVLCDVRIENLDGSVELASDRYKYAEKAIGGWVAEMLAIANFIPLMSPLIRRADLAGIRFPTDLHPEDWPFLLDLAKVARCRYVPAILATYRKRAGGRNTSSTKNPATRPGVIQPLRLNLGCGAPGELSWHPMPGFVNLDKALGWRFEDGLRDFVDGSVAGITISHALMYVAAADLPAAFAEFYRVLRAGGVLRVTEDDTANPESRTYVKGWHDHVTLTDPAMMRAAMETAGFTVHDVAATTSQYADRSLCQDQHGGGANVFFLEGVKDASLLFSPHSDDECLWSSFTIIRHKPRVVICFGSAGDYGSTDDRTAESRAAVGILGGGPVEQWDGTKLEERMREIDGRIRPSKVWAPAPDASHPDHVAVALAAAAVFGDRLTRYHTYNVHKVRAGELVPFEPAWAELKRRALACYRTQLAHPRSRQFFEPEDLAEYVAP